LLDKVTDSFSLCFGRSNGILTVGGYDERMIVVMD